MSPKCDGDRVYYYLSTLRSTLNTYIAHLHLRISTVMIAMIKKTQHNGCVLCPPVMMHSMSSTHPDDVQGKCRHTYPRVSMKESLKLHITSYRLCFTSSLTIFNAALISPLEENTHCCIPHSTLCSHVTDSCSL